MAHNWHNGADTIAPITTKGTSGAASAMAAQDGTVALQETQDASHKVSW